MDKIIEVFKPWVDADPHLEILKSDKFGWVCLDITDPEPFVKFATTKNELMCVIAEWFFDKAATKSWVGAADAAMQNMMPYLAQLPKEDAKTAKTIIGLYAKFDEATP